MSVFKKFFRELKTKNALKKNKQIHMRQKNYLATKVPIFVQDKQVRMNERVNLALNFVKYINKTNV